MWISEDIAQARIRSSANILSRVNRDESAPADYPVAIPVLPDPDSTSEPEPEGFISEIGHANGDGQRSADELASIAAEAILATSDDLEPGVLESLRATLALGRPRKMPLTHREAADAVVVGQMVGFEHSAAIFDRSRRHLEQTGTHGNQVHTPGYITPNHDVAIMIEAERTKLRTKAYDRLNHTLDCLSNEKINKVEKARELTSIAVQLATVADKMLPKDMRQEENVHLHIFRPEVRKQSDYEIVEVGEQREQEQR